MPQQESIMERYRRLKAQQAQQATMPEAPTTEEPYDPLKELDPRLLQTGGGDVRQPQQNKVFQGVLDEWWNLAKAQPHFMGSILKVARGVDPQYAPEALQTLKELLVEPAMETGRQAKEAWKEGETAKAITKGALAGVPLIGPGVADIYDELKSEDPQEIKHGIGRIIGLITTLGLGEAMKFGGKKAAEAGVRLEAQVPQGPIPGAGPFFVEGAKSKPTAIFGESALSGAYGRPLQEVAAETRAIPVYEHIKGMLEDIEPRTPTKPPIADVLQTEAKARLERVKAEREAPIAEIEARQQALKEQQAAIKQRSEAERALRAAELTEEQISKFGEPTEIGPKIQEAIDLLTTDRAAKAAREAKLKARQAEEIIEPEVPPEPTTPTAPGRGFTAEEAAYEMERSREQGSRRARIEAEQRAAGAEAETLSRRANYSENLQDAWTQRIEGELDQVAAALDIEEGRLSRKGKVTRTPEGYFEGIGGFGSIRLREGTGFEFPKEMYESPKDIAAGIRSRKGSTYEYAKESITKELRERPDVVEQVEMEARRRTELGQAMLEDFRRRRAMEEAVEELSLEEWQEERPPTRPIPEEFAEAIGEEPAAPPPKPPVEKPPKFLGEKTPKERMVAQWQLFENLKKRQPIKTPGIRTIINQVKRVYDPSMGPELVRKLPAETVGIVNNIFKQGGMGDLAKALRGRGGRESYLEAFPEMSESARVAILEQVGVEKPISFENMQSAKSAISDMLRDKTQREKLNNREIAVLRTIESAFGDALTNAVKRTGNKRLTRAWLEANKTTRTYYETYDISLPKQIKRYIESRTRKGLPPENIIDAMFTKKRTVQNARDMVKALAPKMTGDVRQNLKSAVIERAWGKTKTPEKMLAELEGEFSNTYKAILGEGEWTNLVGDLRGETAARVAIRETAAGKVGALETAREALEAPKKAVKEAPLPKGLEYEKQIASRGVSDQIRSIFSTKETELAAQAAKVAKRKGRLESLWRDSMEHVLDISMSGKGQKFTEGPAKGWFYGPLFKQNWKAYRPKLEAMEFPKPALEMWDAIAQEVGQYKAIPPSKVGTIVDLHILFGAGVAAGPGLLIGLAKGAKLAGTLGVVGSAASWVLGKRALAKIALVPDGPHAVLRAMRVPQKSGKALKALGDLQRVAAVAGVTMTPVSKKQMDELLKAP